MQGTSSFINPISFTNIQDLLFALLNVVIVIATPIVVLFLIYSGFLYVTARGNAEQIKQSTKSLMYAIIGGVIIIGSVAISNIVTNVANSF